MACPSVDAMSALLERIETSLAESRHDPWVGSAKELERYAYARFIEIAARCPAVYADRDVRMIDLGGTDRPTTAGPADPGGLGRGAAR